MIHLLIILQLFSKKIVSAACVLGYVCVQAIPTNYFRKCKTHFNVPRRLLHLQPNKSMSTQKMLPDSKKCQMNLNKFKRNRIWNECIIEWFFFLSRFISFSILHYYPLKNCRRFYALQQTTYTDYWFKECGKFKNLCKIHVDQRFMWSSCLYFLTHTQIVGCYNMHVDISIHLIYNLYRKKASSFIEQRQLSMRPVILCFFSF